MNDATARVALAGDASSEIWRGDSSGRRVRGAMLLDLFVSSSGPSAAVRCDLAILVFGPWPLALGP